MVVVLPFGSAPGVGVLIHGDRPKMQSGPIDRRYANLGYLSSLGFRVGVDSEKIHPVRHEHARDDRSRGPEDVHLSIDWNFHQVMSVKWTSTLRLPAAGWEESVIVVIDRLNCVRRFEFDPLRIPGE